MLFNWLTHDLDTSCNLQSTSAKIAPKFVNTRRSKQQLDNLSVVRSKQQEQDRPWEQEKGNFEADGLKDGEHGSVLSLLALTLPLAIASDPSPLQDFCVGVNTPASGVFVNGKFCKDPRIVSADDFFSSILNRPGNVNNAVGSNVTTVNVNNLGGLNTLGISLVRIDYAPNGQNPPHTHPRATEILIVQQGTLLVGFVSSNQDGNRLFAKMLNAGDVFVFPEGLIHFQFNLGRTPAVAIAALSSQNAGVITIANTVFGSNPAIDPNVLARAFQMDANVIRDLQNRF
ncbi:hypothetical protein Bca101_059851 [Brassica carinata]